tara:strand:- start:1423 stop:4698 length:3276 start_codon:yes stop_codon:yes gene_type:complete
MHKKHQISVKDLKKLVNSNFKDKEFDFFGLKIDEQNKTSRQKLVDAGADLFYDTLGSKVGRDIGDGITAAEKARQKAVDVSADALFDTFGPAPEGLQDFVDSINTFLNQAAGVWSGVKKQFSETRRRLDRKFLFDGSGSKQAIFRVEPQNPKDYPLLSNVKQHFLIFPEFCGKNLNFTIKNYSGVAPSFTDPGGYCLSKRVESVLSYWESVNSKTGASYRKEIINSLYDEKPGEKQALEIIDKKVDQFIDLFDKYIRIEIKKATKIAANLAISEIQCTLPRPKAKELIRSIYLNNTDLYHPSGLVKRASALKGQIPCILDCFPLILSPVYFSIFQNEQQVNNEGAQKQIEKMAIDVMKKGHSRFLSETYLLNLVPKLIKGNQNFKKTWFAFTHNRFYNPFNEKPQERGFDHWAKTSKVFTDGSWQGKNGIDMISSVFYSAAEIGLLTAGTSATAASVLKLAGQPGAAAAMKTPQALLIISLSLSALMLLAFVFDPFKTYTKIDDLKQKIQDLASEFENLKNLYANAEPNSKGLIVIEKNQLEQIKGKIAEAGSGINKIIMEISKASAQYGMEDEETSLTSKRQIQQQLDSIVKWVYNSTKKETLDWMPHEVNVGLRDIYVGLAGKSVTAMNTLLEEIEGSKKATNKSLKLILPDFNNIVGGDLPGSAIQGIEASSKSGSFIDLMSRDANDKKIDIKKENKVDEIVFRQNSQTANEDFPIETASAQIKQLHKHLQIIFPDTFYFSDSSKFRTAVINLRDNTFKKVLSDLLDKELSEIKKRSLDLNKKAWHQSSFFGWFDTWAEKNIVGRWPTVPELKRMESKKKQKGFRTSGLKDDKYRVSGLGLMSSPGFAASAEVMTIMIGPSASLYNTSLFVGNQMSTSSRAMAVSQVKLYSNNSSSTGMSVEPIKSDYSIIKPPKLAFLESVSKIKSEMKIAFLYNNVLEKEKEKIEKRTNSSQEQVPVLQKGGKGAAEQIKLVEKYKNLIEICNIYYLVVKKIKETFENAINLEEWKTSISNFESKSKQLDNLTTQQYGSGAHLKLVEDLRRDAVKIMNLYYNYDRIVSALQNSSVNNQINFSFLFSYILKNAGDSR